MVQCHIGNLYPYSNPLGFVTSTGSFTTSTLAGLTTTTWNVTSTGGSFLHYQTDPATLNFGTNATSLNTPSTIVSRDIYGNSNFVNVNVTTVQTTATGQTVMMTAGSPGREQILGTSTMVFDLPDATTAYLGQAYIFDNDSTQSITVKKNDNATVVATVVSGGYATIYNTD